MRESRDLGRDYANVVNQAFDDLFTEVLDKQDLQSNTEHDFARELRKLFDAAQADWYSQPHSLLVGKNLTDYLDSLEEDNLIGFLLGMSEVSDYPLHDLVKPYLLEISQAGREQFIGLITSVSPSVEPAVDSEDFESDSDAGDAGDAGDAEDAGDVGDYSDMRLHEIYRLNQLLPLAGLWPDMELASVLLDWFLGTENPDERVAEALSAYLRTVGEPVCRTLIAKVEKELDEGRAGTNGTDYLLQDVAALAKFDDELRAEAYLVLRKAFKRLDNKIIPTICLGDLGTARAIPLLRTYVEKHQVDIDKDLYYEILSSINRLGGSTKDLPDPFGDFTRSTTQPVD